MTVGAVDYTKSPRLIGRDQLVYALEMLCRTEGSTVRVRECPQHVEDAHHQDNRHP